MKAEKKSFTNRFFNSLFWKIGITFLIILLILSGVYLYISVFTAEMYFQEASQKLNAEIAPYIAVEKECFVNGEVNEEALQEVFQNVMIINPSIEVYLLDTTGRILTFYAPHETVVLDGIDLEPVKEFIKTGGKEFVMGDDPKDPHIEKVFSAAPVYENDILMGYIYIILASEEFHSTLQFLFGSYILRLGLRSMTITLAAATIISLIALGFIIRNIKRMVSVTREFNKGNLSARINYKGKGELREFADSFNEMADTIVRNIEEIKMMDNLRRELVANVSHDLRTPLATIQGYLETILIKENSLNEKEKKKYLETTLKSTERLKRLVDELFELSKLEAREKKPNPEAFSFAELAQDVQQKNLILAQAKNIKLEAKFPYNLPLAYADIGMMEKVLQNLLENAIKFTPDGGEVILNLYAENNEIVVNVKDNGQGISKEDLPHIFDRYNRGKRVELKNDEGLGLGLAIVKKILEVQNIEIFVESHPDGGTKFLFKVPVYNAQTVKRHLQVN